MISGVLEEDEWGDAGSIESDGHVGPWPAFVDLFAATSLVLLVFFIVVAYRYVGEAGDVVRVRQLYEQLKILEQGSGEFVVQRQGADVLLILEERVTFKTDQAVLLPPAREVLNKVIRVLRGSEFSGLVREIEILGHADRTGNAFSNWQLSAQRAVSVAQFLVDSIGMSPCMVTASGRGAYFPRNPDVQPRTLPLEARRILYAKDRRVEVMLRPTVSGVTTVGRTGCRARREA